MSIQILTKEDILMLEKQLQEISAELKEKAKDSLCVFTTKELAHRLKVSTKTVNNWREARLIEYSKIHGVILFTEIAVREFLSNHSIKRKSALFTSKTVCNG